MSAVKFPSIIIVNYNGENYLRTCLSSVLKTSYKNFEVVVYDDCSTDKSVEIIKLFQKKNTKIKFVQGEFNKGAAASRNEAVKYAKGDVYVFLDNDTEVEKDWLRHLLLTLSKKRTIGASQALLINFDERNYLQVADLKLWAATGWGLAPGSDKKLKKNYEEVETVALSTATAVRRESFKKIGGFDEKEAVYTEDLDFFWRLWIAGYEVYLSPKAIVYHRNKNVSMRKGMNANATHIYFHLFKNSLRSVLKNYQLPNAIKYGFYSLIINFGRALYNLIKKRDSSALVGSIKGLVWSIQNLSNTLAEKRKIDKFRKRSDEELFDRVILKVSVPYVMRNYLT